MRRIRKNVMRLSDSWEIVCYTRDDETGRKLTKQERGYCVRASVNGWHISSVDDNLYDAYKYCLEEIQWCLKQPPREDSDE